MSNRRKYRVFINPEGKKVRVYNMRKFAEEIGANYVNVRQLATGKICSIHKWYNPKHKDFKHWYYEREVAEVINILTKERHKIGRNLLQLAKKLNVSDEAVRAIVQRKEPSRKDWALLETYKYL